MNPFGRGGEDVGWMYGAEVAAYAITVLVAAVPLARVSRAGLALFGGVFDCDRLLGSAHEALEVSAAGPSWQAQA